MCNFVWQFKCVYSSLFKKHVFITSSQTPFYFSHAKKRKDARTNLHQVLDHFHEPFELGQQVNGPVGLVHVEPALAAVLETAAHRVLQRQYPLVFNVHVHLFVEVQNVFFL